MRKLDNSLMSGEGWGDDFIGEIIYSLRNRGFSDHQISKYIEGEKKKKTIKIPTIGYYKSKTFRLVNNYYGTIETALLAGKYDLINPEIYEHKFRFRGQPGEQKLVKFVKYCLDYRKIFYEAEKQGLERPTFEDALNFGVQYPDVQLNFSLIFLHEPHYSTDRRVVQLYANSSSRGITLGYPIRDTSELSWNCLYPFIVKK